MLNFNFKIDRIKIKRAFKYFYIKPNSCNFYKIPEKKKGTDF